MKKLVVMLSFIGSIFVSFNAKAQTVPAQPAPDFYAGKWNVLVKGTPNGDVTFPFTIVQKDGKLDGTFTDPESKKDLPVTKIDEKDGKVTIYFTVSSYDVNLALEKVDDTHVKGSLMGMFDSTGERVKQ